MPSLSSVRTLSTCCLLVSGFLTEIAQHIHSLRARGVRSSHEALASASEARVFRKSSGNSWTTPPEISFLVIVISLYYYKIASLARIRIHSCKMLLRGVHFTQMKMVLSEGSPCRQKMR